MKDPVADGRAVVSELFPHARWALLTGSVITAARTAGSDLDVVVLLPDGDMRVPHRDSRRFRSWPVDLFVHDESTLAHYLATELAARKPHLHRMLGTGLALVGDPAPWPERCAKVLAGGPPPLDDAEHQRIRYGLTDLLDDLKHASDPGERTVIASCAWRSAGDATLSLNDRCSSSGSSAFPAPGGRLSTSLLDQLIGFPDRMRCAPHGEHRSDTGWWVNHSRTRRLGPLLGRHGSTRT